MLFKEDKNEELEAVCGEYYLYMYSGQATLQKFLVITGKFEMKVKFKFGRVVFEKIAHNGQLSRVCGFMIQIHLGSERKKLSNGIFSKGGITFANWKFCLAPSNCPEQQPKSIKNTKKIVKFVHKLDLHNL